MIALSKFRRSVVFAAAAFVGVGALTMGAASGGTSASAATVTASRPDVLVGACAAHSLCLWRNSGWGGTRWTFTAGHYTANAWIYVGNAVNDQASSLFNNRANVSGIAADLPVQTNGWACVRGGSSAVNLQDFSWRKGVNMNDSISSFDLSSGSISGCPSTL
jgi:hypothetical protein